MSVDELLAWAPTVSERYELVDGVPIAMAAERAGYARAKLALVNALREAIARVGVPSRAWSARLLDAPRAPFPPESSPAPPSSTAI